MEAMELFNSDNYVYPTENNPHKSQGKRIYKDDKTYGTVATSRQPNIMVPIKNNTKKGHLMAEEGDGVYTQIGNKRGTVQKQSIQTVTTRQDLGVVENIIPLRIRRITPREALRLMGLQDQQIDRIFEVIPQKGQRYKLAGNSITTNVLEAIFKNI